MQVDTVNPPRAILQQLTDLTYPYMASRRMIRRVREHLSEDHHYGRGILDSLVARSHRHENLQRLEVLQEEQLDEARVQRFCYHVRQGLDYLKAAEGISLYVKPDLSYYGILNLSKALIEATFVYEMRVPFSHGLRFEEEGPSAKPKMSGVFNSFVAGLGVPDLVEELVDRNWRGRGFSLDESLAPLPGITPPFEPTEDNRPAMMPIFACSFILSNLVRYCPEIWRDIMLGTENELITLVNRFEAATVGEVFGNVFLNTLDWRRYGFYPAARLG